MTTYSLVHRRGFIRVPVWVELEGVSARMVFALDTGASHTIMASSAAGVIGVSDQVHPANTIEVVTAGGMGVARPLTLARMSSLGRQRRDMRILVVDIPSAARVDGLLGLDFLAEGRLALDFGNRLIQLDE